MSNGTTGTIYFNNLSQLALWDAELVGQLSDGIWEHISPRDHWKFWSDIRAAVDREGPPRVVTNYLTQIKRRNYAFNRLYAYVGDRMLAYGRMARAVENQDMSAPNNFIVAKYMPSTLEAWLESRATGRWERNVNKELMERDVTEELARAYYNTSYTMNDLQTDVAIIKRAMCNICLP
jgi:hypothetical protein